jgi:acyl-CoA synthetase (AMP-forming)/AMP-acid ligase II
MISHANLLAGVESVGRYIPIEPADRLLGALPFSFDYGLNQLSLALAHGATLVLHDYLLPQTLLREADRHGVTVMALVANLWIRLAAHEWPAALVSRLRHVSNSGGALPVGTVRRLRHLLPNTRIHLMYGLTEAFRATSLPPQLVDLRPDSIGLPVPGAELRVLRPDGSACAADEPGELVQAGPLVTLGYWRADAATAERFRPAPAPLSGMAVYSGDRVRRDPDGYFYFLGRMDEQIKTSGYRVSPAEIEEVAAACDDVQECVVLGLPHAELGQAILLLVRCVDPATPERVAQQLRAQLPTYQVPARILRRQQLPLNPNGKIDRPQLHREYHHLFLQEHQSA